MSLFIQLYDTENGGPARAFECHCQVANLGLERAQDQIGKCGKVCRTKRGMIMHLERVHHIKIQMEIFDVTNRSDNREKNL